MDYIKTIDNYIKKELSTKRYSHSIEVAKMAQTIASKVNTDTDTDKYYLAGLSHDIARELPLDWLKEKVYNWGKFSEEFYKTSALFHGPAGAYLIKEKFGINNMEIQEAIAYHSVGNTCMSSCAKVVYVADYISYDRNHITEDFRNKVLNSSLDEMIILVVEKTAGYLRSLGLDLLPETRNMYLMLKKDLHEEKKGF